MAHFFKPPMPQVVQTFRIPLGETWDVALWGIDKNTGDLTVEVADDTVAAAFPPLFPPRDGVMKFALRSLKMGSTRIEGKNARGAVWARADVVVTAPVQAAVPPGGAGQEVLEAGTDYSVFPTYIDKVKGGHYDVDSNKFTVDHEDGSTVELPYKKILAEVKAAKAPGSGAPPPRTVSGLSGFLRDRATNKIHPLQYNEKTVPNLAAMVLETESVIQNADTFIEISKAFLEIVAVYAQVQGAAAGMRPKWKVSGAKGPAGRPKLAPNVIQGNPPSVKIGSFGQAGNLIARVEATGGQVVYRIDAIVLQGEGSAAEIATARLAHREMLVQAAKLAQRQGLKQFILRGIQANANFRAHADKLAQLVGVAGSGKAVGGIPGALSDYEVILDAAKVLASQ